MALSKRGDRGSSSIIWPGFVDAMTALLLVLMFVLSIFMIVQFILREELTGKDQSLRELTAELGFLQEQLGLRDTRITSLEGELSAAQAQRLEIAEALAAAQLEGEELRGELADRVAELAALTSSFEEQGARLADVEAIAAALREERDEAQAAFADLERRTERLTELEEENARLAAETAEIRAALAAAQEEAETTQLTLQEKIAALELAVEEKRKEAEETLALLAAIEAKQQELGEEALAAAAQVDQREAALAYAQAALAEQQRLSAEGREAIALLNSQVLALRRKIQELTALLDAAEEADREAQVTIARLDARLAQALARKVDELADYRSEFFGRLRQILGNRDDVQIVGDRFIFRSEVLLRLRFGRTERSGQGRIGPLRPSSAPNRAGNSGRDQLDLADRRPHRPRARVRRGRIRLELGAEPGARVVGCDLSDH